MQLGFVSAILPEFNLEEVLAFAADEGFACVEIMCWPPLTPSPLPPSPLPLAPRGRGAGGRGRGRGEGQAERRYAGVTHVDVANFTSQDAGRVNDLAKKHGVRISALGYYPNPLHADAAHRTQVVEHLKKVIAASSLLGINLVTTFIGRDQHKSVDDNWPLLRETWTPILKHAEANSVRIAIENCPMLFSLDEWPGGVNLATTPAIWRKMFDDLGSDCLGLNFDPSHLVWQHIDYLRAIRDFGSRFFHVHAKDTRIDVDRLYERGIMGLGWHTPKLPGLGDVHWGMFFSLLGDTGYNGPVCIEVEDRAYERSLEDRKRALRQSKRYLEQWIGDSG